MEDSMPPTNKKNKVKRSYDNGAVATALTTADIDVFFEKPSKQKKTSTISSYVARSMNGGTSYITTNEQDGAATHLVKIEIYDMRKLRTINPTDYWKNAELRVKYHIQSEEDEDDKSIFINTRNLIYDITKKISSSQDCKKYFINQKAK